MENTQLGVGVREAARILGISPNAIRMRIRHKTMAAYKDGEEWRIILPAADDRRAQGSAANYTDPSAPLAPSVQTTQHPFPVAAHAHLAVVIRVAVAPFVEELERVYRELGAMERELAHERERAAG